MEKRHDSETSTSSVEKDAAFADINERKLMTRIDLRVIPALSFMYLLSFLDRTNIGNALSLGLETDMKLNSNQYNNCLLMMFISSSIFEVPSNICLKKFGPARWLSLCMVVFGIVTLCTGFVKSYSGLLATRFFLGFAECGITPGCFYVISMYYKRSEAQKRFSFFFSAANLAGAFGGLIAYGISHIRRPIMGEAHTGLEGAWRWIFIIEGAVCILVGIVWYWVIPNFPEHAHWLSNVEKEWVTSRLAADSVDSGLDKPVSWADVVSIFTDYKSYLAIGAYFGGNASAYAFAYFGATIVESYGYSEVRTQLMIIPAWVATFVFANIIAYFSDRLRHRFFFIMLPLLVAVIGYAILLGVHTKRSVEYLGLAFAGMGTYSAGAIIICWFQTNLGGHARRAIGSALIVGIGNLGGIVAVYTFPSKDAPEYKLGYGLCIGLLSFSALCLGGLLIGYVAQNKKRAQQGITEVSDQEQVEKGDTVVTYRYMY